MTTRAKKEVGTGSQSGPDAECLPGQHRRNTAGHHQVPQLPELKDVFQSFYILPSIFNTDLDRGFSIIDCNLNELYASEKDLKDLNELGIALKFDFVLNHSSVLSKQFQDILTKGEESKYKDFFINWNKFWEGRGQMTEGGYIQPDPEYMKDMFFRKPGLPILNVRMPDGKEVPYWNTFYQEVKYEKVDAQDLMRAMDIQYASAQKLAELVNGRHRHRQEVRPTSTSAGSRNTPRASSTCSNRGANTWARWTWNIKSPLVWKYYKDTHETACRVWRGDRQALTPFAYAPKEPGSRNFLNEPGTWDLLAGVRKLADQCRVTLLPEIHSSYREKMHEKLAEQGYMTYDFFLPGLIIDALENHRNEFLIQWARDMQDKGIRVVNMLGCHDGIPLLDLKGLIPDEEIEKLIDVIVKRGGYVKDLHGKKNMYYQVECDLLQAPWERVTLSSFCRG